MKTPPPRLNISHIGFEMAFHHPRGADINPSPAVIEAYEAHKEHAEIFVQNATGTAFSQVEILNWFLLQTHTSLDEHLPPLALNKDHGQVLLTIPIRFKPNMFHMKTEIGAQDLSHLKLMCTVNVKNGEG